MKRMWSKNELKSIIQNQASNGDLKNVKVFEEVVDKNGNKRFIDIVGTPNEIIQNPYCKASLSGSHLLLVCAGSIASGGAILTNDDVAIFELPEWMYTKIIPVWAGTRVEVKSIVFYNDDWSSQSIGFVLTKLGGNKVSFKAVSDITLTKDRAFRAAFDLLIDND